jgi:hypothetical protein
MGIPIFVGLLFFAIGVAVLIGAAVSILKKRKEMANSLSATGSVTSFVTEMGGSGHLYYPVLEFKIPSGQTLSFKSSVGSNPARYSVGQPLKVVYDAHHPQQAEIDDAASQWIIPGCMLAMGLAFTIGGLLLATLMILLMINQP